MTGTPEIDIIHKMNKREVSEGLGKYSAHQYAP